MSAAEILVPAKFTTQMLQLIVTSVIYQSQYENVDSNDSTTSESLQAGVTLSIIFLAIEMGILFTGLTTQFQKTINHTPCIGNCPSCLVHIGYMAVWTHLDDFLSFLVHPSFKLVLYLYFQSASLLLMQWYFVEPSYVLRIELYVYIRNLNHLCSLSILHHYLTMMMMMTMNLMKNDLAQLTTQKTRNPLLLWRMNAHLRSNTPPQPHDHCSLNDPPLFPLLMDRNLHVHFFQHISEFHQLFPHYFAYQLYKQEIFYINIIPNSIIQYL